MDSSNRDEDEEELYDLTNLIDIKEQYFLHCLAKKGLADTKESSSTVNLELPEFLQEMLKPDCSVQKKSKDVLDEIKSLFPLKPVVKKTKSQIEYENRESVTIKKEASDVSMDEVPDLFQSPVTAVGSVTPVEDFLMLLKKKDVDFDILCEQIQTVILDLLVKADDLELLEKPVLALKCLRRTCIDIKKTAEFNSWLHKLKETAVDNKLKDFWNVLVKDKLGLITRDEMQYSFYSKEEGDQFLDFNMKVKKSDGSDEEIDYDAMLMEM